ncbi:MULTISPECIES: DUF3549 family protein [unclassified Microbulbifer]|uniref:DUF3549 family protein n=1 Tax=unclassified Microbulbifer TaxID=2619833 RepID=UPI0027E45D30|nr:MULTISPECIES: DUF3549 family protein [unclassified Microbulbifer]
MPSRSSAMGESGTLGELIAGAQFKLRWFDLGRRVQPLTRTQAEAFESGRSPWPHPYLRHAWTGLLLWPEEGGEPAVWFLRLPLDEQGKLQLPVRDGFLRQLTQQLCADSGGDPTARLQSVLDRSELVFDPLPERRASFHARAGLLLKRPPSEHYAAALEYCRDPDTRPWDRLALQGVADLAARWEEHGALLQQRMVRLAAPVFINLCQCLENEAIDHRLAAGIIDRARSQLAGGAADYTPVAAAVRGISHSVAGGLRREFLREVLQGSAGRDREVLAAIGSRCPRDLERAEIAEPWLAALAENLDQETFNLLLTDLLFLPQVRPVLLGALRNPARPESLARAFGILLRGSLPTH